MQRKKVDLPDPLGPITAAFRPHSSARSIPFRTSRSPKLLRKPSALSTGGGMACLGDKAALAAAGAELGLLPIGRPVDVDPRVDVGRREPPIVAQAVFLGDLVVQ